MEKEKAKNLVRISNCSFRISLAARDFIESKKGEGKRRLDGNRVFY